MNLSVKASYQPTFMKLWAQCQRDSRLPKQPGELRFDIDIYPPMHGPDALDFVTFTGVPEEFARLLTEKGIPYVVN